MKEIVLPSLSQRKAHNDYFNSTDSIWVYDMLFDIAKTNLPLFKYIIKYPTLLLSYCMYNKSLSMKQKLCYLENVIEN